MPSRQLTPVDRFVARIDDALRAAFVPPSGNRRPNPAADTAEADLGEDDRRHAAGLMRVNHAGEIAAQGLYQGHAAVARDEATRRHLQEAAGEELDHLEWCSQRLAELGESPSRLAPLWYAGSFAIGVASGILGDRWSLGFVEETERQVSEHLSGHLRALPERDARSRAIVEQMRREEEEHGRNASAAGAAPLPEPVRGLMRLASKIMTTTAYRV